jgi:IMP cyclohydrolase
MNNPSGPYPGRQLFIGLTETSDPLFAYLVTGRSPESRERKAVLIDNMIRMGPLGNLPYDPLRHYTAVKYDNRIGVAVVSNGIQTEAIFETYKLLFHTASSPNADYMRKILEGAGSEPDSYHTPRIAGIISSSSDKSSQALIIGIKAYNQPASAIQVSPKPGTMVGISTYKGSLDNPEASDPSSSLPELEFKGASPKDLAGYLYDISRVSYKGNDIRVCSIGAIRSSISSWNFSIINVHND